MRKVLRRLNPRNLWRARLLRRHRPMPNQRRRTERFLMVQQYIKSNESGRSNLSKSLKKLGNRYRRGAAEPVLLPSILAANAHFSAERFEEAAKAYRSIIRDFDDALDFELNKPGKLKEGRQIEYLSVALAILNNNLAEALAEAGATPAAVRRTFEAAIGHQADMEFVRENYGYYLARQFAWDEAEAAHVGAAHCKPGTDSALRLSCNLAALALMRSEKCAEDGDIAAATEAIVSGLARLPSGVLQGHEQDIQSWRARLYLELGTLQKRQGAFAKSQSAFERSESDYGVADKVSSAFAALNVALVAAGQGAYEVAHRAAKRGLSAIDASRVDGKARWPQTEARLRSVSGLVLVLLDRGSEGRVQMEQSARIWKDEGWTEPFEQVLTDTSELWSKPEVAHALKQFFNVQIARARADKDTLRLGQMTRGLAKLFPADLYPGEASEFDADLMFKPLSVEMDEAFLYPAGGPDKVIDTIVPALRTRLEAAYGVVLPSVRLRGYSQSAPNFNYVLLVAEVPRRVNLSKANALLAQCDAEELRALDIGGTEARDMVWLMNGPAHWVPSTAQNTLAENGVSAWDGLDVPFLDLERLLERDLSEIFGHQAARDLLITHDVATDDGQDQDRLSQSEHMIALTQVLTALVSERVPLNAFEDIHKVFYNLWRDGASPSEIVIALREDADLALPLWGNSEDYTHFAIGPRLVAALEAALKDTDGTILALEPEHTQEILSVVREEVRGMDRPALVVPRRRLRALLHVIFKLEFPDLPVLSTAELQPGLSARVAGTIDLDEALA